MFELEEDNDVFNRYIKEEDPQKEYEIAKRKANIAKVIREVKEVDYNNTIRMEKRVAKNMAKYSQKLIKQIEEKLAKTSEKKVKKELELELENYKNAKKEHKQKMVTLDGKKLKVNQNKADSVAEIKAINDNVRKNMHMITKTEKAKSEARIRKLRSEHTKKVNEIIARENKAYELQLKNEKAKLAKAKAVAQEKLKQQRLKEQQKLKEREAKIKQELRLKEQKIRQERQKQNKEKLNKALKPKESVNNNVQENNQE